MILFRNGQGSMRVVETSCKAQILRTSSSSSNTPIKFAYVNAMPNPEKSIVSLWSRAFAASGRCLSTPSAVFAEIQRKASSRHHVALNEPRAWLVLRNAGSWTSAEKKTRSRPRR